MVWIISELFYPDEVSTAQIMTDVAQRFSKKGIVSILAGPIGYEKSYHTNDDELNENILVYRVSLPRFNKNNLVQRILKLFLITIKMSFFVLFKIKKGDRVLQVTNPILLILTTSFIKKIKGFTLEILVHDVYPENLVPAGLVNKNGFKYKVISKFFNYSFSNADRLIVLGEDMKQLMLTKTNNKVKKIDVITNWSDEDIKPIIDFNKSEYLQIEVTEKTVIGFAGNLGRVQGIIEFIAIFNKVENSNLILTIIGDGALKNEISDFIVNNKIQNVFLLGSKSRKEQINFLNSCDIGLITLNKGMKGLGVPSKTYNIMASGKPILFIGDKDSEIDTYCKKYNCGWSFDWDEEKMISFFYELIKGNKEELITKGLNSYKTCNELFLKKIILDKF
nr:glycosyltransferase family 4 protein [uncultured Flavobacterium sp.]